MEYYDESYDYIITKPELNEDLLMHFGVKGMRWGHRKQRPVSTGIKRKKRFNQTLGYKAAHKARKTFYPTKAEKNSPAGQARKERAKKIAKGAAIAAGVAVTAMGVHTFVTSPYAKGNRMYVAGKTKQALYTAGRKFADSVIKRRQAKAAKAYTKTLPRIGAKKVIDTSYRDLSTGASTYVKKNRNNLKNNLKTAAAAAGVSGAVTGAGLTGYATAKNVQNYKKKKKKS